MCMIPEHETFLPLSINRAPSRAGFMFKPLQPYEKSCAQFDRILEDFGRSVDLKHSKFATLLSLSAIVRVIENEQRSSIFLPEPHENHTNLSFALPIILIGRIS